MDRFRFEGALALGAALTMMFTACGQAEQANRDADQDGDVDEAAGETHYMSPILPFGVDPKLEGVVATVSMTTTSMGSRGEIRGLEHAETLAAAPPSPYHADVTSPPWTYSFDTGSDSAGNIDRGGSPGDSNVAASSTHVCLTARGAFACYDKGGQLVALGAGTTARPYNAQEFFNLSGISPQIPSLSGNPVKDGRVVFDPIRQRFFFVFQTREGPGSERLLIAVSKSEDPRDGFWTYGDYPNINNPDGTPAGQDYDRIGINQDWFLVSNGMGNAGEIHFMYSAANLVNGTPYTRGVWSHTLAQSCGPAVHQSASSDAFWVNRDDATHVSVWAVRNGQVIRHTAAYLLGSNTGVTPEGPVPADQKDDGTKSPMPQIDFGNIGWGPQNVDLRNNKLTWVANESHTWSGQSAPSNVARVVQMDVSTYFTNGSIPVTIDRAFGASSAGDPAGSLFDYGWPAVASNANGDLVIGTVRTNASIFPQLRASVWPAGASDIDSSILSGNGTASNPMGEYHMAGAAADPTTSGVYLSQMLTSPTLPSGTWWRIHVVKELGTNLPDIIATNFTAPANVQLDVPFTATVTVQNQGDAPMPASTGGIYLDYFATINPGLDTQIGSFYVPSLAVNATAVVNVTCTIPSSLGTLSGPWTIGPALDRGGAAAEQSERNNFNPFLTGLHGNAQVTLP
jgi:hypothetical protein